MDAVTIRRLIVFGVCAVGVAALYVVPSVAGPASTTTGRPSAAEESGPRTSSRASVRAPQPAATGIGRPIDAQAPGNAPTEGADQQPEAADRQRPSADRPATDKPRTAFDPDDQDDSEPPAAVPTISPAKVTAEELSLSWPAATDNRRVIGYRIWLNGYEVATTAETHATVHWFNDDEGQHVVQIKAVDAAGNQSRTWSTLLVTRPAEEETPRPTPTPTPTPEPSESSSSVAPEDEPTAEAQPKPEPSAEGEEATTDPEPSPTAS